jgi:hypothetical protein
MLRRIERRVRCAVGDVEEERLVVVALDDRRGGLRAAVDVISLGRELAHRAIFAIHGDVCGEGLPAVLRIHMPEAMPRDLRQRSEVPFAELRRHIACVLQPRGDRGLLVEAIKRGAVVIEIKSPLKAPRHESATRRHALRRGAVAMLRDHTTACQFIEMRRTHISLDTTDAKISKAMVIRVEEDEVRPRGEERRVKGEEENQKAHVFWETQRLARDSNKTKASVARAERHRKESPYRSAFALL